jgi:alkylation response protein AidB-like acyl-CoA dehydrogenase
MNFWQADPGFQGLLSKYLPADLFAHLVPYLDRMGQLAGDRLDTLATLANEHPPVLHPRDRFGRDDDWLEYHPAYQEMENLAFGEFGLHTMTHRPVMGWHESMPASAKYAFHYLFAQAECGFLCPINVTDTTAYVLERYGSPALKEHFLPRLLSQDMETMWKGTQFMTEKSGGSDVGALETTAEHDCMDENGLDRWRLYGDKWFASHTTADVALILARPVGAPTGTKGLALFAMPHRLANGSRNHCRMVRLKDKLGTRSLASCEIVLDGAEAYLVGDPQRGLKQIMDQVNQSRLSHGVRAAGMMRRCLNEAMAVAHYRRAFGERLIDHPLMRRQLLKIMLPTEQALSMATYTAHLMDIAPDGLLLRLMTPLTKFRACRDNIRVASAALEVRGGNGYIEDWVNARLARDAQVGTLWEGTSSINAIDVMGRAVGRLNAQKDLGVALHDILEGASAVPSEFRAELHDLVDRTTELVAELSIDRAQEQSYRSAASALYNVSSAVLLADEGTQGGDARRLLLARLVVTHRLRPTDPLDFEVSHDDDEITDLLFQDAPVALDRAAALVGVV